MFAPAGLQDHPDVVQEDSMTELKLQTKCDLRREERSRLEE